MNPKWKAWYVWGYVVILIALAAWELIAVLDKDPATPPLTQVAVYYAPPILVLPFLLWLYFHFAKRFFKRETKA